KNLRFAICDLRFFESGPVTSKPRRVHQGSWSWGLEIANRKSQIANRKSQIANRKSQIANRKSQIANLSLLLHKLQGGGVHAVAQAGRRGAIVEHVAQVGVAARAKHLGAAREQRIVGGGLDV